jgi:hypothetical protein
LGIVSAQSQGYATCSFAKASPKPKNPRSERPQHFLNRSSDGRRIELERLYENPPLTEAELAREHDAEK